VGGRKREGRGVIVRGFLRGMRLWVGVVNFWGVRFGFEVGVEA